MPPPSETALLAAGLVAGVILVALGWMLGAAYVTQKWKHALRAGKVSPEAPTPPPGRTKRD